MRPRGTGTQRADGTWRIVVTLTSETGVRRKVYVEAPTQREVQRKAAKVVRDHNLGRPRDSMTLEAFLRMALERRFEPRCAEKTVAHYRSLLERWIVPTIGMVPLDALKPAHVEDAMQAAAHQGKERTANMVRQFLRAALTWGMKLDVVERNVAALADPVKENPQQREMMLRSDLALVLAAETNRVRRAYWTFLAETGLRPGEAARMEWRELREIEGEWWLTLERSKTAAGRKPIPIDRDLVAMLREIRMEGCPLVFPSPHCNPHNAGNLSRAWYEAIDRANESLPPNRQIPRANLYQLRKLFAREVAVHAPDYVLKALMRHTDAATTKRYYLDAERAQMIEAIRRKKGGSGGNG